MKKCNRSGKHGKTKRYSTYGNNIFNLNNIKSKKGKGYHGKRKYKNYTPIEYRKYLIQKSNFYTEKKGFLVTNKLVEKEKINFKNLCNDDKIPVTNWDEYWKYIKNLII